MPRRLLGLVVAAIAGAGALSAAPASADACPAVTVPGAEHQVGTCLSDLTTAGTLLSGHTDKADWAGLWNGGLVVAGSPGNRETYANDFTISDWALARGYAYAATDKGNTGVTFYRDGAAPGDAVAEWNERVSQLAVAAKAVTKQRYGMAPRRTIAAGQSNGGYLVRWQLENRPDLFDGGVDWEGVLWTAGGPNLLTFLPPALRAYPADAAGMAAAGFWPESAFLWDFHYRYYWDLTQRVYREEFDPAYDGDAEAGTPFCASGTPGCDTDYDYASRPRSVRQAVARVALTTTCTRSIRSRPSCGSGAPTT
ncbi:tannase/feruloyl esterase family alpha/beta hydrolase [Planotetraspora sp. A-T 1434]|uniref:tannase/feruloyl esterase family alpha/beta hydrolase n=1 Tax=Planotetraspora sp. A-T 1434 TaxID=2979219 RepID=UPI0021BE96BD|nr:tannase/feruloyl esterase family alpha/beta hydrolase [Planotetraspora sp. A-T 1434]MCT9931654.1 tannase/feruloyl esterase family alpha/beta hydrolase [Planotetraspora sp. A-T 1434]